VLLYLEKYIEAGKMKVRVYCMVIGSEVKQVLVWNFSQKFQSLEIA